MRDVVDPFIGTAATNLPPPTGLAATWWSPKPQVGNTHPGACHPFGMVSACAYSGAYPTGYGLYDLNTEGRPLRVLDRLAVSGFTHFQQSGTGAIRKYYNYVRVSPMLEPLDVLGRRWDVTDEEASPGHYAATLDNGIRADLTVGPKSAVHRYTFPASDDARVVIDLAQGGLAIEHGATIPTAAAVELAGPMVARAQCRFEGVPVSVHVEVHAPGWRTMLWYDRRLMAGGRRMDFDSIRETTVRPFGLLARGPIDAGGTVEVRLGFSLRGDEQAESNLRTDVGHGNRAFHPRRAATASAWDEHLGRVVVEGGTPTQHTIHATALYHAMVKPCFAPDESPFWPQPGPWAFDLATMWDIYKTQLPLLTLLVPDRAVELVAALVAICEHEGNLPIGYRMARGSDRFHRQGSSLAHTFAADVARLGIGGLDLERLLVQLTADLRRDLGEQFAIHGIAHPVSHTLDLAQAHAATADVARLVDDEALAKRLDDLARHWRNAFDPTTGLLVDSTFYEGGRWNYSFRLLHDMRARVALAGGDAGFVALLDRFFGFGADPVTQLGEAPSRTEVADGMALHRFEGLNNEPDMEAPWAYLWAGRADRTAEVVQATRTNMFGTGPGGLPGNDDSGGLSAWLVWAGLGMFPVAGQGGVVLHPPAFPHARLRVDGHQLDVDVDGPVGSEPDQPVSHVRRVWLDDSELDRAWVSVERLRAAGRLRFELGHEPTNWGRDRRPPSLSDPT